MKKTFTKTMLVALLTSFITIFAAGCGSSFDDGPVGQVTNNNGNINPQTGTLVFRFQQVAAQAIGEVPEGTTTLRFDLHSGDPPTADNLIETRTVSFSTTVELDDVPDNVTTATVTSFGADGAPTGVLTASNIDVNLGGTAEVFFDTPATVALQAIALNPDPIRLDFNSNGMTPVQLELTGVFDSGTTLLPAITYPTNATFTNGNDDVFTVSTAGLVTPQSPGPNNQVISNNNLTISYTLDGVTQQVTIQVRTGFIATDSDLPTVLNQGDSSKDLICELVESEVPDLNVTNNAGLGFSVLPSGQGVTVDGNGSVTAAGDATAGDYTLTTTLDFGGTTYSEDTPVIVID